MHPADPRRDQPFSHDRRRYDEHSAHSVDDGRAPRRAGLWVGVTLGVLGVGWVAVVILR